MVNTVFNRFMWPLNLLLLWYAVSHISCEVIKSALDFMVTWSFVHFTIDPKYFIHKYSVRDYAFSIGWQTVIAGGNFRFLCLVCCQLRSHPHSRLPILWFTKPCFWPLGLSNKCVVSREYFRSELMISVFGISFKLLNQEDPHILYMYEY